MDHAVHGEVEPQVREVVLLPGITQEGLAVAVFGVLVAVDLVLAIMKREAPRALLVATGITADIMESTYANMGVHTQHIAEIVEAHVAE